MNKIIPSRRLLLALGALAPVAALPVIAMSPPRTPDAEDAELIRLCDNYMANLIAYENSPDLRDSDEHPLWPEYIRSFEAMQAHLPAQTMAGVMALARLAKFEAAMSSAGKGELWEGTSALGWAVDVVNDLLRIHGESVT